MLTLDSKSFLKFSSKLSVLVMVQSVQVLVLNLHVMLPVSMPMMWFRKALCAGKDTYLFILLATCRKTMMIHIACFLFRVNSQLSAVCFVCESSNSAERLSDVLCFCV